MGKTTSRRVARTGQRHRRGRTGLAVLVGLSFFAAACGDEDDDSDASVQPSATQGGGATTTEAGGSSTTAGSQASTTTAATLPSDMDPNGILKYAARLISTNQGVMFDPVQMPSQVTGVQYVDLVMGTLMQQADDGSLEPWMAEDVEVVDPQTVRITLRPGVTFTDGAKYDAEAVKAGLLRTRFESATPAIETSMDVGLKALTSVDVVDPLTVVAHLDKPIASVFVEVLAGIGGVIVSPKQAAESPASINTNPIGAGPYVMQKFVVDQVIEYRKNPNFWDADSWKLAGIDYVQAPVGTPRINAMLADAVDFAQELPIGGLEALKADSDIKLDTSARRYSGILLCHKAPIDNLKFRQAISIGIDRDEYNELLFNGDGEPAYGQIPSGGIGYNKEVADFLKHDVAKAKQLLAESGVTDASFDIYLVTFNANEPAGEVIQEQLKEIGITVNLKPVDNVYAAFIEPQAPGGLLTPLQGLPFGTYAGYSRQVEAGGAQAFCGLSAPEVMAEANKAAALSPDDPKAAEALRAANLAYVKGAYHIPVLFEPLPAAWNTDRVGGEPQFITLFGNARPDFSSMYIKK